MNMSKHKKSTTRITKKRFITTHTIMYTYPARPYPKCSTWNHLKKNSFTTLHSFLIYKVFSRGTTSRLCIYPPPTQEIDVIVSRMAGGTMLVREPAHLSLCNRTGAKTLIVNSINYCKTTPLRCSPPYTPFQLLIRKQRTFSLKTMHMPIGGS